MSIQKRIDYIDALRACAMLAIVVLHVTSPIVQDFSRYPKSWWWIANMLYAATRPAIALFMMISGMMLLSPIKEESLSFFFKKRFIRIGVPFVAWGAIYFVWKTHGHGNGFSPLNALLDFVKGPVYYHLWFIYTMAGIYLATPVFRVYTKAASLTNHTYLLVLWFTGTAIYPLISRFTGINVGIPIMVAGGFLGCFLLGSYLGRLTVIKSKSYLLLILLFAAYIFTALSTYLLSAPQGIYDGTFVDFLCPNVLVMAVCCFFLFQFLPYDRMRAKVPALYSAMLTLSATSFSVYLMHIMLLEILRSHLPHMSIWAGAIHPLLGIPLTTIIVLGVCVPVVVLLRKIPYVKFVLP